MANFAINAEFATDMTIDAPVVPVAGLGTGLLPATKSRPKEMLSVGRKPVGQDVFEELARRRSAWQPPARRVEHGYGALCAQPMTQAHERCDFDFLQAGAPTPDPEIH